MNQGELGLWVLVCGLALAAGIVLVLVRYVNRREPLLPAVVTGVAWYFAFSVCFILPIDLTVQEERDALRAVWRFVYWGSFVLTWLVIPVLEDYYKAGAFTFGGRLWYAIKANLKLYLGGAVASVVLLTYIATAQRLSVDALLGMVVCMTNAFGLSLVVALLGHGLVAIPRALWTSSHFQQRLDAISATITQAATEYTHAREQLYQTCRLIEHLIPRITGDTLATLFAEVRRSLPSETDHDMGMITGEGLDPLPLETHLRAQTDLTVADLVHLHLHVKAVARHLLMAHGFYDNTITAYFHLETVLADVDSPRKAVRRDLGYGLAACLSMLSLLVIWCEITIVPKANLSPLSGAISWFQTEGTSQLPLWLISAAFMTYQMVCCGYGVLTLRLPKLYYITGNRRSDGASLLFSASNLLRLHFALTYNFLQLIRVHGTAFEEVMGSMTVIPFFGTSFNEVCPISVLLIAILTLSAPYLPFVRCAKRLLHFTTYDDDPAMVAHIIRKERRQRTLLNSP
ncbi:LMBR1-domain-containing protein [uncultured virus]|nr:LMBR1-domain-containing protein [uncultured virus]